MQSVGSFGVTLFPTLGIGRQPSRTPSDRHPPGWRESVPRRPATLRFDTRRTLTPVLVLSRSCRIIVGMDNLPAQTIHLVEDDPELSRMIAEFLTQNHFAVRRVARGDLAIPAILEDNPDAVVLDLNLPGADGLEVCRQVRPRYTGPIIILTARGDEVDEIVGLELGADDYIAKPVRPRVLLARLRAHMRKAVHDRTDFEDRCLTIGDLVIDAARRSTSLGGEPLQLTSAEFDLLWLLAENEGKVVSRDEIYRTLLGLPYDGTDRSIDLRVSRLRRKLGDDPAQPERIKSVRGVGYILVPGE